MAGRCRDALDAAGSTLFEAPDDLVCPITLALFKNPVITTAGTIYEEHAIRLHMQRSFSDPLTGQRVSEQLTPVIFLRSKAKEYAQRTATQCMERIFAPDCIEPERYLRRACELCDGAGIKLKGMHSVDFHDPIDDFLPDARFNGVTLTEARHDADLRLLFSYACMLAMRESTNAAASLAAYYMRRTGAHVEVAYILNICLTNGWPKPRSPAQPGTPGAHVHAGHALREPVHEAHAALDSDPRVPQCGGPHHACGATVAGDIPGGHAYASACAAGNVRDAEAPSEPPASEAEPEDRQHRQLRPRDEAFVADMVAFLLSERWLQGCIPEFLDILMNSLEANELSPAEMKAVCEGLLHAATPAADCAARGAARTDAAAADFCTEALLGMLSEPGAAVLRPDRHAPTQHLWCSCPACDVGTWCGQSGHGVSPSAAAGELRGRFERSQKALQVVPVLLEVTEQCKRSCPQGARAGQNVSEKAEHANVDGAGVGWLDEAQRTKVRTLFQRTLQVFSGVGIAFVVLVFLLCLLLGGRLCLDVLHRIVSALVAEEGLERQRMADAKSEL